MRDAYLKLVQEFKSTLEMLWLALLKGPLTLMALGGFIYMAINPTHVATLTVNMAMMDSFHPEYLIDLIAVWFLVGTTLLGGLIVHRYLVRDKDAKPNDLNAEKPLKA